MTTFLRGVRLLPRLARLPPRLQVDPGKEHLGLAHPRPRPSAPGEIVVEKLEGGAVEPQLLPDSPRCPGHIGGGQEGREAKRLVQAQEHGVQLLLLSLFGQLPGHGLVDVLVGAPDERPDRLQGLVEGKALHGVVHTLQRRRRKRTELGVQWVVERSFGDGFPPITDDHLERAVQKIAQVVRQVAVDAPDKRSLGEVPVMAEGHLAQQKITEGVSPIELRHPEWVHDVTLGLAHLLAIDRPPAVGDDRDGGLQPQGQEHERPDDAVEADDVLAHHVPDGRPVFPEHLGIVQIPHRRGVIDQGVEPDINHVLLVARNRDSPLEGRPGHGLIPHLPPEEAHDLVVANARHDPVQVLFVMVDQPGDVF